MCSDCCKGRQGYSKSNIFCSCCSLCPFIASMLAIVQVFPLPLGSVPVLYPRDYKTEVVSRVSKIRFENHVNTKINPLGIKPKISSCLKKKFKCSKKIPRHGKDNSNFWNIIFVRRNQRRIQPATRNPRFLCEI